MQRLPAEIIDYIERYLTPMALFAICTCSAPWRRIALTLHTSTHCKAASILTNSYHACLDIMNMQDSGEAASYGVRTITRECRCSGGIFSVTVTLDGGDMQSTACRDARELQHRVRFEMQYCIFRGLLHRRASCETKNVTHMKTANAATWNTPAYVYYQHNTIMDEIQKRLREWCRH